ncbi:metal-dependent hydrolase [Telmatospirillum sp. J64-1]|uniref:metal-dependent hydrolase n=1 Tax=Telmatospirillum sp. J64-1 TaxID=2502183 RepID=UPI00115E2492|nr:metal-dependent hydrolase [Telmatospirillum sp. J64-1]
MMAKSHMVVGGASWVLVAAAAGMDPLDPQGIALAVFGALLPDIDHPQSWAGRKFRLISVPLAALVGHRGVTHSLLATLACLLAVLWMGMEAMATPLVVGYLSHLAADTCTPSGVPYLWPSRRRFTLNLCRTGSAAEYGIVTAVAAGAAWAAGVPVEALLPN